MYQGVPLQYFMLSHQHSTQANIQSYAEDLFKELSPKLKPYVFLLGILRKEIKDRYPICIQPEDCGVDVTFFNRIDDLANSILEKDSRRHIYHGMPYIHENFQDLIKRDSIRRAVQQLVDENFKGKNSIFCISICRT